MKHNPEEQADRLRRNGLRRTPMRLRVLELLGAAGQNLSVPQIMERFPSRIDKVTLYRTLHVLTEKKLLHRVRGDDQAWRYGMGGKPGSVHQEHAHFVCDQCGNVECLAPTPPPAAAKRSAVRPGYRVEYSEVLVHGTCAGCQR